jgi:hypothetical protein
MTKSAKQDTKEGPVDPAETGSAATTDPDAAKPAKPADAKPAKAAGATQEAEVETAAESAAVFAADDTHEDDDKPDIDEVKAKFREALDRKRQVHAEGQGKGAHEAGKVSGAHGPAASRRNFRRKSG